MAGPSLRPAVAVAAWLARWLRRLGAQISLPAALALLAAFTPRLAHAETFAVPVGAKPINLGLGVVVCSIGTAGVSGGWTVALDGHGLRPPPAPSPKSISVSIPITVAANAPLCAKNNRTLSVVATAPFPAFSTTVPATVFLDEGRLEARGRGLAGAQIRWAQGDESGLAQCSEVDTDGKDERCSWPMPTSLSPVGVGPTFQFRPSGAPADAEIFDLAGERVTPARVALAVDRYVISPPLGPNAAIDASVTEPTVPLHRGELVATVECGGLNCVLSRTGLGVRGALSGLSTVNVALHFQPRIWVRKGDGFDAQQTSKVPIVRCPLSLLMPAVARTEIDQTLVVLLGGTCAKESKPWKVRIGGENADIQREEKVEAGRAFLVTVGRVQTEDVIIAMMRPEDDAVLASLQVKTQAVPVIYSSLTLDTGQDLDFIPTNTWAKVHLAPIKNWEVATVPEEGVYEVQERDGEYFARGLLRGSGLVTVHYALRGKGLPAAFGPVNQLVLEGPIRRLMHDANIPMALGEAVFNPNPPIELRCALDDDGPVTRMVPGKVTNIDFHSRDSCRLVFHRDRVPEAMGSQKLRLDIDVVRVDAGIRPEGHVSRTLVFSHGPENRTIFVSGIRERFDRVNVRLGLGDDENHYVGGATIETGTPAAQWTVIMGKAHWRYYASTSIPSGLYRVSDKAHSGVLALNFGVLSRLGWLDREGRESLIGAEAGLFGIALTGDAGPSGQSLTQFACVSGLGVRVPFANRSSIGEASVNVHAWFEYEPSRALQDAAGSPIGFIFGPSISIGNVGIDL